MEERHKESLYMTEEMEYIQIGYRINHLIGLLESMYKKRMNERDQWWVMRFSNLLDTLETVSSKQYKYLRDEVTNTTERLNLNHPIHRNIHV